MSTEPLITLEMIREMEAHFPFALMERPPIERWEWKAAFLTRILQNPDSPWCDCCTLP